MTPRAKPPHTLVSVLHWLWYCRATALSALANLTLLLGKNTLPFPAFGNLNFVSPPHRRAYTSIPKSCPNIRFPHQQDFFPIRSVTKSSMARFSHENLVEKIKIFVQDFVPIRTALRVVNTPAKTSKRIARRPASFKSLRLLTRHNKSTFWNALDGHCARWSGACVLTAGYPHVFGGGVMMPSSYIYNRIPHSALSIETLYEQLYGKDADLSYLKTQGPSYTSKT